MKPRSLSLKLVLATVLTTSIILILTILFAYLRARKTVETQTSADAQKVTQSYATQLDSYVDRVAVVPRTIAARQEATAGAASAYTLPLLSHLLDSLSADEAYGAYIAFDGVPETNPKSMVWVDRNSLPDALVAGADLSLDLIRALVDYFRFQQDPATAIDPALREYAFLVSRNGRIIAHPDKTLVISENFPGALVSSIPGGTNI